MKPLTTTLRPLSVHLDLLPHDFRQSHAAYDLAEDVEVAVWRMRAIDNMDDRP